MDANEEKIKSIDLSDPKNIIIGKPKVYTDAEGKEKNLSITIYMSILIDKLCNYDEVRIIFGNSESAKWIADLLVYKFVEGLKYLEFETTDESKEKMRKIMGSNGRESNCYFLVKRANII